MWWLHDAIHETNLPKEKTDVTLSHCVGHVAVFICPGLTRRWVCDVLLKSASHSQFTQWLGNETALREEREWGRNGMHPGNNGTHRHEFFRGLLKLKQISLQCLVNTNTLALDLSCLGYIFCPICASMFQNKSWMPCWQHSFDFLDAFP